MGRKPLPKGQKKIKDAFALSPDNYDYLLRKAKEKPYQNKSRVVDAALQLMRQLEP
jgi:hypothetical protein